jgi:hypothetical protein
MKNLSVKQSIAVIVMLTACSVAWTQPNINRTIPASSVQNIVMHFDYPKRIKVLTWDKNEIHISGEVSINGGENNDAFVLEQSTKGNVVEIRSYIKDLDKLPQRVRVQDRDEKLVFRNKSEFEKYKEQHGRAFNSVSFGPDLDIVLEIKVPKNVKTKVESVYGLVEVTDFQGPLIVKATYGGIDASLQEKALGEVVAETNYGNIYTDLNVKFEGKNSSEDFHTVVSVRSGKGPLYSFHSPYGNVYLRKAGN